MDAIEINIEALKNEADVSAQITAAETLAGYAEQAQPAILVLVQHCGSDNDDLCNWCTAALEAVGPPCVEQIEELTLLVGSASPNVAFWAVTLLGRAGAAAELARPALVMRSEDASTPEVQKRAVWALEKIAG